MALTHKEIEALVRQKVEKQTPDGTPNLYFHTRASGSANWLCRTTIEAKRVVFTLGAWPHLTAASARAATPVIVRLVGQGHGAQAIRNGIKLTLDPDQLAAVVRGEKVSETRATPTFEEVGRDWYHNHLKSGLSEGPYKGQVLQQLEDHVFPRIGRRPINELKRREIVDAIRDLWLDHNPTGSKVRGNIERVFDYAIDHGLREDNPAPPTRSMPKKQHQVEHFKALPYERVSEFWLWLHERPRMGPHTHVGIALAVLLGKRTGEIRKMKWDQIDFANAIWVTPAENMKKRKVHRQPLSQQALEKLQLLRDLSTGDGFVFDAGSGKSMSENTMLYAIKRFDDITTHGFRATLGSWCTDNKVDPKVSSFIKSHQPKYLDAAYSRTDMLEERREVLQRWADFVTQSAAAKTENA
jgi:integrase